MEDIENDPLATAADIFNFETAANLKHPTTIELCGENIVPYDLDDALKVLEQHNGVAPMTRAKFSVEDIEPLCVIQQPKETYLDTLDRLLVANLHLGSPTSCWRVRGLLTAKANPNTKKGVISPMQLAIKHNNVPALYALLHAGADDSIRHSKLDTAMRCAVKSGNADMVRIVGMLAIPHAQEPDLVDVAARSGDVDVLEVLVNELGYDLHQHIMTVHRALEKGHCDVVDFFFKNDAALATKRYRDGRNALTIAAAAGQPAVIDLLVRKYGMQPYDMDALCAAARHDRPSSLRKLASLIQSSSLIQDSSLPQASLPQASLPQASLPQASLPQASLPQASLPQASLPQVNQWMETPDREGETPIVAAMRNGAYVSMLALAEMGCQPFDVLFEMARLNKTAALVELLAVIIDKQGRMQDVVDARHTSEDGVSHTLLSWAAAHGSFNCALEVMRRVDALKKMHV
jgi:ankyrin repeat protein